MKYRPILFSGPMVRALLAGTKTQTRIIVKPQPVHDWLPEVGIYHPTMIDRHGEEYPGDPIFGASDEVASRPCLYGAPGDQLWVRETFAHTHLGDGSGLYVFPVADPRTDYGGPWKPCIHMPRTASRITLEITNVRVERLQEISEEDAIAEGAQRHVAIQSSTGNNTLPHHGYYFGFNEHGEMSNFGSTASEAFSFLWAALNGWKSWDLDPYVWVIEFKRAEPFQSTVNDN